MGTGAVRGGWRDWFFIVTKPKLGKDQVVEKLEASSLIKTNTLNRNIRRCCTSNFM